MRKIENYLTIRYFMSKVSLGHPGGCWMWMGGCSQDGYGQARVSQFSRKPAHRVAYELFKGYIPKRMMVLHRCDVHGCVNPDHLFLGTHQDNMRDMVQKGRSASGERCARFGKPTKGRLGKEGFRGEKNGMSKLTDEERSAIVEEVQAGMATQRQLAQRYGVHFSTISLVVKNWGK